MMKKVGFVVDHVVQDAVANDKCCRSMTSKVARSQAHLVLRRLVIAMRRQIGLVDARKPGDATADLALKQFAANHLAQKRHAAKAHAVTRPAVKAHAAIRLDATVVDEPTADHGHHAAVPMNRSRAPHRVRKLVVRKVFGATTTLSSSMTTMPTVLAAAC
jgi:uncharacterized protein (DUF4415 family)